MRYLPHTQQDIKEMLEVIGVGSLEELFSSIPQACRRNVPMQLPEPMTEWELKEHMIALADQMPSYSLRKQIFLGAGSYDHYIPEAIRYLIQRSEFLTSYTPYQPEISQGTLQAIYEYQTLMSRLFEMEVSNASLYDGATALTEAVLMAFRVNKKKKRVAVSNLVHPHYRQVLDTYLRPTDLEVVELHYGENGRTLLDGLSEVDGLGAVVIQSPNFFGCIEDLQAFAQWCQNKDALLVCSFTEPLAYGLLKAPGAYGADVVCGEGQSLGVSQSYGGPALGIFCTRLKYVRNMPGRLVGKTVDMDGKMGFVLTLATREQHIRREKATSNICTNNNLCAITAAVYLASLGGSGLRGLAQLNHDKCEYLKSGLLDSGIKIPFSAPTFNEFVAKLDMPVGRYEELIRRGIVPGLPLERYYSELKGYFLLCVTETKSKEDIDRLIGELA